MDGAATNTCRKTFIGTQDRLISRICCNSLHGGLILGCRTRTINNRKILTALGSQWHVSPMANPLARGQKLEVVR